jgi:hypothetical protein
MNGIIYQPRRGIPNSFHALLFVASSPKQPREAAKLCAMYFSLALFQS